MAPSKKEQSLKMGRGKARSGNESSDDEYRRRRDRNNLAVKRSRVKSRQKTQETLERVQKLKRENDQLEEKIKLLSKELAFLKDLFLLHASNPQAQMPLDADVQAFLSEDTSDSYLLPL